MAQHTDGVRGVVVLSDYDHHEELPDIADGAREVSHALALAGFRHGVADLSGDGTLAEVSKALRNLPSSASRLVLYWVGHGVRTASHYYLILRDSPQDPDNLTALPIETIGQALARTGVEEILVLVDACFSGGGAAEIANAFRAEIDARANRDGTRPGIAVITSARWHQRAREKVFAQALVKVLRNGPSAGPEGGLWGPRDAYFTPAELARALELELGAAGHAQQPDFAAQGITGRFIANPCHQPLIPDVELDRKHANTALLPQDVAEHFMLKFRGVEPGEGGWFFTGRQELLKQLTHWLGHARNGLFAVTGPAGSGKSAVLGRIAVLSVPGYREQAAAAGALDGVDPATVPPVGALSAGVHAKNRTLDECVAQLAQALELPEPPGGQRGANLFVERVAGLGHPVTLLVDALDEAQPGDVEAIARDLLRPLADLPQVRVLVGTRPERPMPSGSDPSLIDLLAPQETVLMDRLPDQTADIAAYARARLLETPGTPYRNRPKEAGHIASEIAEASGGVFLFARLVSRALAARPIRLKARSPELQRLLAGGVSEAFAADLRLLRQDEDRAAGLLRPLAWAEGAGLPRRALWLAVANALAPSGTTYTELDLQWLMKNCASYLTESAEDGQTVYRLYHQAFGDHFRAKQDIRAIRAIQARIAAALIAQAPADREWRRADPYLLRHLATHADAGGRLPSLATDYGFYINADPERLLRVLGSLDLNLFPLARLYRRCALALRSADAPGDRAMILEKAAARNLPDVLPLLTGHRDFPWRANWAVTSRLPEHRHINLSDVQLVALGALEGDAVLAVLHGGNRVVTILGALTNTPRGSWRLEGVDNPYTSLSFMSIRGRVALTALRKSGTVDVYDPLTGDRIPTFTPSQHFEPAKLDVLAQLDRHGVRVRIDQRNRLRVTDLLLDMFVAAEIKFPRAVHGVAVHAADGHLHLAAVDDQAIGLWSLASGKQIASFALPKGAQIREVALGVIDNRLVVASAGGAGAIHLWAPDTGQSRWVAGNAGRVRQLALADFNGSTILAAVSDRSLDTWSSLADLNLTDDAPVRATDDMPEHAPRSWLVSGLVGGGASDSRQPGHLIDTAGVITAVALGAGLRGEAAAVGTAGGVVEIRDARTGRRLHVLDVGQATITGLGFLSLHNQPLLAVADADRTVSLWEQGSGTRLFDLTGHVDTVHSLAAANGPGPAWLATAGVDRQLILWDADTGRPRPLTDASDWWPRSVAFGTADGRAILAEGTVHGAVRLWDPVTGDRLRVLHGHLEPVTRLAFGHAGPRALLATVAEDVRLWNPMTGAPAQTLPAAGVADIAFAAIDGHETLVTAGSNGIEFWDPGTARRMSVFDPQPASYVALGPGPGPVTLAVADPKQLLVYRRVA